jgi:hypothetical protein
LHYLKSLQGWYWYKVIINFQGPLIYLQDTIPTTDVWHKIIHKRSSWKKRKIFINIYQNYSKLKTIRVTITKCITQDACLFLNCSNFGKLNLKYSTKKCLNMGHNYGTNLRPMYKTNMGVHSTYIQSLRSRLLVEACVVVKATQQISTC